MNDEEMRNDDEMRTFLWNTNVSAREYRGAGEKYQAAILEQYKLYVEIWDRTNNRRMLINTSFLAPNAAILAIIGVFGKESFSISWGILYLATVLAVGQCSAWWWMLRSYRFLSEAKFRVIGALEERLPASTYVKAEWKMLGEGRDWRKYTPLSHVEEWVPVLFGFVYLSGLMVAVVADPGEGSALNRDEPDRTSAQRQHWQAEPWPKAITPRTRARARGAPYHPTVGR
jgi:hypothetical protein